MLQENLNRLRVIQNPFRRVRWTQWVLIAITLGIALWFGLNGSHVYVAGRGGFELFLFAAVMLVAIGLMLFRIELGVMAIVFTSFFVRFSLSTGSATAVPASLVVSGIAVALWVATMLVRRNVRLVQGSYVAPTLIFIVISILSIPWSWLLFFPDLFGHGGAGRSGLSFTFVQLGGVTLMILLPAVMLMTANVLKQEKWFKLLFGTVLVVAFPELLQRFNIVGFSFGTFVLKTGASYSLWIVALSVGMALFHTTLARWKRVALLVLACIWLYIGSELGAQWFSGWMPAAVAVLFLTFIRSRKVFLLIVAAGVILFFLREDHYMSYVWGDAVNSDSNRFDIWKVIIFDLTLTKTNLFFGAGPAGYLPFYEYYYPGHAWVSHNNYVDIFAEVGLVGFTVFLWMLYTIFMTGWQQREKMPTPFLRGFNYGVLAGFVGTLMAMGLGDWHIPFVYNIGIPGFDFAVYGWLLCGAMLALQHLRVDARAEATAPGTELASATI